MNRRLLLVVAFALGALACPAFLGGQKVTATIGAAGGTLRHPSGAMLTVPPGALDSDV